MWNAVFERIRFWRSVDRLGPDVPWTHWRLHWPVLMRRLAQKKFYAFGEEAEFRAGAYAVCCSKISLGKQVVIRPGSMLFADPRVDGLCITIEDRAMLGSSVHIYVSNHEFSDPTRSVMSQGHRPCAPVVLREGCWVGAGSIILPGVTIGKNAVVGAGSVVTHSIPDGCVAAGSPARIIKSTAEREEAIRHA